MCRDIDVIQRDWLFIVGGKKTDCVWGESEGKA
jgi:hypothetical protein